MLGVDKVAEYGESVDHGGSDTVTGRPRRPGHGRHQSMFDCLTCTGHAFAQPTTTTHSRQSAKSFDQVVTITLRKLPECDRESCAYGKRIICDFS